jgi:hypothetical protein
MGIGWLVPVLNLLAMGGGVATDGTTTAEVPAAWEVPVSRGTWKVPATTGPWEPPASPGRWEA